LALQKHKGADQTALLQEHPQQEQLTLCKHIPVLDWGMGCEPPGQGWVPVLWSRSDVHCVR